MVASGERISGPILWPLPIQNLVLEPEQSCKHFLLPSRMKTLLIEMCKTLMVSVNIELSLKKIVAPMIHCQKDG
jgi:hypothetical protein